MRLKTFEDKSKMNNLQNIIILIRQKVNSIAISLGQHIESLQRTIAILKEERDEDINQEVQTQFKLIETLVYV